MTASNSVQTKPVERLLAAIDLMEFGIKLMRQNIVRKLPGATKQQIDSELQRWLIEELLSIGYLQKQVLMHVLH